VDAAVPERGHGEMKADLHTHTVHSDGRQSVDDIIRRAKELGMGAVAIADHNTMDGCPDRADGIIVLRGVEITDRPGGMCWRIISANRSPRNLGSG